VYCEGRKQDRKRAHLAISSYDLPFAAVARLAGKQDGRMDGECFTFFSGVQTAPAALLPKGGRDTARKATKKVGVR
jgi:hypothetical protein